MEEAREEAERVLEGVMKRNGEEKQVGLLLALGRDQTMEGGRSAEGRQLTRLRYRSPSSSNSLLVPLRKRSTGVSFSLPSLSLTLSRRSLTRLPLSQA